jgi:hypothetical protein
VSAPAAVAVALAVAVAVAVALALLLPPFSSPPVPVPPLLVPPDLLSLSVRVKYPLLFSTSLSPVVPPLRCFLSSLHLFRVLACCCFFLATTSPCLLELELELLLVVLPVAVAPLPPLGDGAASLLLLPLLFCTPKKSPVSVATRCDPPNVALELPRFGFVTWKESVRSFAANSLEMQVGKLSMVRWVDPDTRDHTHIYN